MTNYTYECEFSSWCTEPGFAMFWLPEGWSFQRHGIVVRTGPVRVCRRHLDECLDQCDTEDNEPPFLLFVAA